MRRRGSGNTADGHARAADHSGGAGRVPGGRTGHGRYPRTRLDEAGYEWSEPELFISNETPVAELSMTSDGRELTFAQIFWRDDGTPGIDIYYSRKTNLSQ